MTSSVVLVVLRRLSLFMINEYVVLQPCASLLILHLQQSDRSRGFGFITMSTVEEAGRCIKELNGVVCTSDPAYAMVVVNLTFFRN